MESGLPLDTEDYDRNNDAALKEYIRKLDFRVKQSGGGSIFEPQNRRHFQKPKFQTNSDTRHISSSDPILDRRR